MASEIHEDDVGTRFLVTVEDDGVVVNISGATLRQLTFLKPSDDTMVKTASIIANDSASSGIMYYDTVAEDLDEVGVYKMQGKITLPSGSFYSNIVSFQVHPNITVL